MENIFCLIYDIVAVTLNDDVTITKKEYDGLLLDSDKLSALEAGGVDNWEGYSEAVENL